MKSKNGSQMASSSYGHKQNRSDVNYKQSIESSIASRDKLRQQNNNNSKSKRKGGQYEMTETSLEAAAIANAFPTANNSIDLLKAVNSNSNFIKDAHRSLKDNINIDEDQLEYNNEQDLFFLQKHIQMNEEGEAAASAAMPEEDQLMEDEDDQKGVLNFIQKFQQATCGEFLNNSRQRNQNRNEQKLLVENPSRAKISSRLIQLENSVDDAQIKVPIKGQQHKKIINMGDKLIGDYKIEKTLGQGTFGKVKQGYHIFTGQKVAIKILDKWKIDDVNDIERVAREIHILRIVRHPHIIQLYEIIETKNRLFLIMEHCCNGELFNYITSKNHLKEDEACRLFQQLISGIEYLGELGIAHRDIKPENLLLDQQKNLKIVDFGLSNTFKANEKLVTACGSPCYAAPELIKGLEYIGPKADIWSAGVVLYCLVCGHLPFEDQNTQSLYQKILSANYHFTCQLSQEVRNLIENILVPEPALRYGLKQIKQNAWYNLYKGESLKQSQQDQSAFKEIKVHNKLIREMKQQCSHLDLEYARCCIAANQKNNVTAHYNLLLKKKNLLGESISDFSQADQDQFDVIDEHGKLTKRKRNGFINEKPIPGGRQVRDFHSIPAAPRHNLANFDRQSGQMYNNYGYHLKKMNEGLIDLKNEKNGQILMKIESDSRDNSMQMQQSHQQQQWDFPENDFVKAMNMNRQAQKKNNAQIKKIVDRNNHAPTNSLATNQGVKTKVNQSSRLKNPNEIFRGHKQVTGDKRGYTNDESSLVNQSLEKQAISSFNPHYVVGGGDQLDNLNQDDYTIQMQMALNQASRLMNYDQMSNGQQNYNRDQFYKDNKSNSTYKTGLQTNNSKVNSATRSKGMANNSNTPSKNSKVHLSNSQSRQFQANKGRTSKYNDPSKQPQRLSENKRTAFDSSVRNVSKLSVHSGNKHKRGDSSFLRLQKGIHSSISQINDVGNANATQTIVPNTAHKFSTIQKKSQMSSNRDAMNGTKTRGGTNQNNQSGQFIKLAANKGSVNRINHKNQTMSKPNKQQQQMSAMVTQLVLNQNQMNQKSQRSYLQPSSGKNNGANSSSINKSNSISKKSKMMKNSLVDFTRNPSNGMMNPQGQNGSKGGHNLRANQYNTQSSIDHHHPNPMQDPNNDVMSNPISLVNSSDRRNDGITMQPTPSENMKLIQSTSNTQKISRKHIRANTSINNYNSVNMNGLAPNQQNWKKSQMNSNFQNRMDVQDQPMLNSYGPGQKSDMSVPNTSTVLSDIKSGSHGSTDATGIAQYNPHSNININGTVNEQQFHSNQLKDKLNITNSLIISNSQILFQDIGNGKIIPIPFSQAMGTIQPTADQSQIEQMASQNQGHHGPQHQASQSIQLNNERRVSQNLSNQGNYRTSNSQDKQISSLRSHQNQSITNPQHLQGGMNNLNSRREVLNSRQQRRKTAQSTRFNTLMQDQSGPGLRDRFNDLHQSYGKAVKTSMGFDSKAVAVHGMDYHGQMIGAFKDNSKSSLQNTIAQPTQGTNQLMSGYQSNQQSLNSTQSRPTAGQRNQYRTVSMSLGNSSKNKMNSQNYRTQQSNGQMNQTQGQRVIHQITGSLQTSQIGSSNQQQHSTIQNKIPTFHKGHQKVKHGISKSITDSATVSKNLASGQSQIMNRQNQKLSEQYRSHQNRESSDLFNSKERFVGTSMQVTSKMNSTNVRQSRQNQRVPVLSQQVTNSQRQNQSITPGHSQKMKNARNMSNQSQKQNTSNNFNYQSKGAQKAVYNSLSMNQTQNMQPISGVVKQPKQQNQTQNLEKQLTNLLEKQEDFNQHGHHQNIIGHNIEQNLEQINSKIQQMKVVGGTPQMMAKMNKQQQQQNLTSSKSNRIGSAVNRSQKNQQNIVGNNAGESLQTSFYARDNAGQRRGPANMHQSIELSKATMFGPRHELQGSSTLEKSRDFDNNIQTINHDQQRKLIRDNYLQGFQQQMNQPLGLGTSLENSKSASTYQRVGLHNAQSHFNQSLAVSMNGNANGSVGTIQNNHDMKRNLRMIKMNKHGSNQSGI